METRKLGMIITVVGFTLTFLAVYQAYSQAQVKVVAWYDMNGDNVINFKDFDLNGDNLVNWVDVRLVQDTVSAKDYVERYDFNRDGTVDQTDVDIITTWMGKGKMALYDMNGDDVVDWHDLDVNSDGVIDIFDISTVARAYGSKLGDENYDPRVDFNQDSVIDDSDIHLITPYYGYPLSLVDFFNPALPTGQMFIAGLIVTVLGICTIKTGGKK